jgi:hypothetical protein
VSSLLVGELAADSLVTSGGHRSATRRMARRVPLGREAIDPEAAGVVTDAGVPVAITLPARFSTATPFLCLFENLSTAHEELRELVEAQRPG